MHDPRIDSLAKQLAGYSTDLKKGEKVLLDLYDVGDQQHTQMVATRDRCRERVAALHRQKHDIDATIAELEEFCAFLDDRLDQKDSEDADLRRTGS